MLKIKNFKMKSYVLLLLLIFIFFSQTVSFSASFNSSSPVLTVQYKSLNANNINSFVYNTGVFNQDFRTGNSPGFEWPKGSNKFAIFTSGISIAAYVRGSDGVLRLGESMASYIGEWSPGYILNGTPTTPTYFHIFSVKAGDNASSNPDYANWGQMVPFGAPYKDVNNNGVFDNGVDIPGMPNSAQTIFQVLTDGFSSSHNIYEGFGGGITNPLLKAELHMTAWCYGTSGYEDAQFLKFEIINKNDSAWRKVYFGIVNDPDLGDPNDDYIGCDTARKLGFCYNGRATDAVYGTNPPAVGMVFLKGAINRSVTPNVDLGMTSFTFFTNTNSGGPVCERDPNPDTLGAYNMLKGFKKDGSPFMNPKVTPYAQTKFCYNGDPATNTGWNEAQGCIQNCGGTTGNLITTNPYGDRRFIIASGADNLTVKPNEKQTILISQMITGGTSSIDGVSSNLTAVSALKTLCDNVKNFYLANFPIEVKNISSVIPDKFYLYQNYPNPFNPATSIRYQIPNNSFVTLKIYDMRGKEIAVLVNEYTKAGVYEASYNAVNLASGVYYYKLTAGDFSEVKKMVLVK